MGVFTDLAASAKTIDFTPPALAAGQRPVAVALDALRDRIGGDVEYPSGFEVRNEVQQITNVTADGGTYTLTITLRDGTTFTTAAIAVGANAATIQAAIDTASPASVGDGHIVVTGGAINAAPIVLTYSGATVAANNHGQVTVGNSLTNGGPAAADPAVSTTTNGQTARWPWALLKLLGVISDTPPIQGTSAALTSGSTRTGNPYYPDQQTIRALAEEAGIADLNSDVKTAILTVAGLSLDGR